jgi:hypothetical protein
MDPWNENAFSDRVTGGIELHSDVGCHHSATK